MRRRRILEWLIMLFLVEGILVLTLILSAAAYRYLMR
jgi:hypothetical protein